MTRPQSRTGDDGFTLIEMLVVLTVAALLLAVAAPRLSDTVAHARLKASAERLAVALRQTRAAAMLGAAPEALTFAASHQAYSACGNEFILPHGQVLAFQAFGRSTGDRPAISFLSDGSSSGGVIKISSGVRQVRIDVDWLSGRIALRD